MPNSIVLDGHSLTLSDLVATARDRGQVSVSKEAAERCARSREVLERRMAGEIPVYGVNTGFGKLADVVIASDKLVELQRNLIRSHVAGVGDPLPTEVVRAVMLLRANALLQPTSGARPAVAECLAAMLNAGIHPVVPEQGSVGASGDLAPLSHVAHAVMGEGSVDVGDARTPALQALQRAGIEPIEFQAKEGLSFINGTQVQTAILALLVHDARNLWRTAHGAAAMSLEALRGTPEPFDARLHDARPHAGQIASAALLRELLEGSEIRESHRTNDPRVQDAYSLRCTPQILGPVLDTIDFAASIVDVELNASTDNPVLLDDDVLSGGNFHGQAVALPLDYLAIALTTVAGVSERRIDRMVNPDTSQGLPPFLTHHAGLQSGFMMVQIVAASLVAESRALCMPGSVQSIPTDGGQEDYVPMGMASAHKARRVLANAQRVVAAELITAAQGLEFLKPLKPGHGVQRLHERVRDVVEPFDTDRPHTPDLERLASRVAAGALI